MAIKYESLNINVITTALTYICKYDQLPRAVLVYYLQYNHYNGKKKKTQNTIKIKDWVKNVPVLVRCSSKMKTDRQAGR